MRFYCVLVDEESSEEKFRRYGRGETKKAAFETVNKLLRDVKDSIDVLDVEYYKDGSKLIGRGKFELLKISRRLFLSKFRFPPFPPSIIIISYWLFHILFR